MADKLRKTFPIKITLANGEQPTASKLTAIATQAQNGLAIVESAIGDIWNQSGDSCFGVTDDANSRKRLHVTSLGRGIGNLEKIQAEFDPISSDIRFYDKFTGHINGNVGVLHEKPNSVLTWSAHVVYSDSPLNADASGDVYYDSDTQKVFSYSPLASGDEPYFDVVSEDFSANSNLTPNLLPPSSQTSSVGFGGCKVVAKDVDEAGDPAEGNTRFYLILPPRVTDTNHNNPNVDDFSIGTSNNTSSSLATDPKRYYWNKTTAIDTDADSVHYRYILPSVLDYGSMTAGSRLPDGFLRLWDDNGGGNSVGRVVDSVAFYKPETSDTDHGSLYNQTFVVEIDAPGYVVQLNALCSADDEYDPEDYNTGLRILTVGSSLSERVEELSRRMKDHNHSWPASESYISSRIRHKDLINLDPDSNNDPFSLNSIDVRLLKSQWQHDDHLQYLSRAGSQSWDIDNARDIYNNAFLGHFLIASTLQGSLPYYNNLTANSFSLYFGEVSASAPRLFYSVSDGALALNNKKLSIGEARIDLGHIASDSNAYSLLATGTYLKVLPSTGLLQSGKLVTGTLEANNAASSTPDTSYSRLTYNKLLFSAAGSLEGTGSLTYNANAVSGEHIFQRQGSTANGVVRTGTVIADLINGIAGVFSGTVDIDTLTCDTAGFGTLSVNGDSYFLGTMFALGNASVSGLITGGTLSIASGKLTVSSTGKLELKDSITVKNSGGTSKVTLDTTGNIWLAGNLTCVGSVSSASLSVTGQATSGSVYSYGDIYAGGYLKGCICGPSLTRGTSSFVLGTTYTAADDMAIFLLVKAPNTGDFIGVQIWVDNGAGADFACVVAATAKNYGSPAIQDSCTILLPKGRQFKFLKVSGSTASSTWAPSYMYIGRGA